MKKMLSLLLLFTMLWSLCACGDNSQLIGSDSTDQTTTANTEEQTDGTTEAIEISEEMQTAPTEETVLTSSEKADSYPTTTPTNEPTMPTEQVKPVHTHSFSAATCTQPKTCTCGLTEGVVQGHSWNDATCTVAKTCSTCGAIEGTAAGHNWQEANCTMPKYCTICNITEGDVAKHIFENYICTICNATDEEGIAIATNPKLSFKPRIYQTNHYKDESTIWSYRIIFNFPIDFSIGFFATRFKNTLTSYVQNVPVDSIPRDTEAGLGEIYYTVFNGTKYYYDGGVGGSDGSFTYELTDSEIIVSSPTEVVLKFKMNIDGTLTVTYSNTAVLKKSNCGFLTGDVCW